jgi:hypothetical protein
VETTEKYLAELVEQKKALVNNIADSGIEVSHDERINTLVPKVTQLYEAGKQTEYNSFWDTFQESGGRYDYQYAADSDTSLDINVDIAGLSVP